MQQNQQPKFRVPEGLNAAQMQVVTQSLRDIAEQMNLRRWCIEKALSVSSTDPVKLAQSIYDFIVPSTPTVIEAQQQEERQQ